MKQFCKHIAGIIQTSSNNEDLSNVLAGSRLEAAYKSALQAESELEKAKKALSKAKKDLSKIAYS